METIGAACLVLSCAGSVGGLALAAHADDPAPVRRLAGLAFAGTAAVGAIDAPLAGWGGSLAPVVAAATAAAVLAVGLLALLSTRAGATTTGRALVAALGIAALAGALARWWLPDHGWPIAALAFGLAIVAAALTNAPAWLRWGSVATVSAALALSVVALATSGGTARALLGGLALVGALLAAALVLRAARPDRRALVGGIAVATAGAGWLFAIAPRGDLIALAVITCAAPFVTLAGGARRALLPAISRGLAAAAGALAGWTLASTLGWDGDLVMGFGLLLAAGAVIAIDASSARRILLPRRGADSAPLAVGDHALGRYRLLSSLGEGAFSTTWRAVDEVTGARVAVKALRTDRATASAWRAEAAALRDIKHPNVVRLLDVGSDARQTCLVMDLVEGGSLADRLARKPLSIDELARVGTDLLDALSAVHAAGIVHRDVKPSNVLLTSDGRAKLADFGIAIVADAEATLGGDAGAGSIRFMSPEQARGRRVDATSDLYSAAATLYEAYTGEPYAKARRNESAVELRLRISEGVALSDEMRGGPLLRAWFEKGLAPDPSARFATAGLMHEALREATKSP